MLIYIFQASTNLAENLFIGMETVNLPKLGRKLGHYMTQAVKIISEKKKEGTSYVIVELAA